MANENEKMDLARRVVDQFILDWEQSPYHWQNEVDIQVEIASRLRIVFQNLGWGSVNGKMEGWPDIEVWPRISCEPSIRLTDGTGKYIQPDIVMWDDSPDSGRVVKETEWDLLWACELKSGDLSDPPTDIQKLIALKGSARMMRGDYLNFMWNKLGEKDKQDDWDEIKYPGIRFRTLKIPYKMNPNS